MRRVGKDSCMETEHDARASIEKIDGELERLFVQRMEEVLRLEDDPVQKKAIRQPHRTDGTVCGTELMPYVDRFFETLGMLSEEYRHQIGGAAACKYSGFGVLGESLTGCCLPLLHTFYGEYEYRLFATAPQRLEEFMKAADFRGINVETPYRSVVPAYLDELSATAQKTQSVNVVLKNADGRLVGHNTDYDGFADMMRYEGVNFSGKSVMILGNGATSRTVAAYVTENGAKCVSVVGRNSPLDFAQAYDRRDTQIIINTTPVGMRPDNESLPIDISAFMALETVIDTVYSPLRTRLYSEAEKMGVRAVGGLYMLVAQTKRSAELFTGTSIEHARVAEVYAKMTRRLQNIVLIGMPGCGKSSIGKRLARLLGKRHLDTDRLIVERVGKSIDDIFAEGGEAGFREIESRIVEEVSREEGCVISTGGGTVLRGENVDRLKQNGKLVWIDRAVSALEVSDRPLFSDPESVKRIYAQRRPIYQSAADLVVKNRTSTQIAAKEIAKAITGKAL